MATNYAVRQTDGLFDALDRNHDGAIDRDEFAAMAMDEFAALRVKGWHSSTSTRTPTSPVQVDRNSRFFGFPQPAIPVTRRGGPVGYEDEEDLDLLEDRLGPSTLGPVGGEVSVRSSTRRFAEGPEDQAVLWPGAVHEETEREVRVETQPEPEITWVRERRSVLRPERLEPPAPSMYFKDHEYRRDEIKPSVGPARPKPLGKEEVSYYSIVSRVIHETVLVEREVEEVVFVPEVQYVERPVYEDKEVTSHRPVPVLTEVTTCNEVVEVPGDVVYFDNIIELEDEVIVEEPELHYEDKLVSHTYEVVHHVPKIVEVEQVVERLVQRPVLRICERTVQVPRVVPYEKVVEVQVSIKQEKPIIQEEIIKVPRKVQVPRMNRRELVVEVPRIVIDEQVVEERKDLTEEVIEPQQVLEAMHHVRIETTYTKEVSTTVKKPREERLPKIEYVDRKIERPVHKVVDVHILGPGCEVVKTHLAVPRAEYRDKPLRVPKVRRVPRPELVYNEIRGHEVHHVVAETEEELERYCERFEQRPKITREDLEIPLKRLVIKDRIEEVPVIKEVIKYEEVTVDQEVSVVRQVPRIEEVEKVYKVPKYVFYDELEYVDLYEEHLIREYRDTPQLVERREQKHYLTKVPKPVIVSSTMPASQVARSPAPAVQPPVQVPAVSDVYPPAKAAAAPSRVRFGPPRPGPGYR